MLERKAHRSFFNHHHILITMTHGRLMEMQKHDSEHFEKSPNIKRTLFFPSEKVKKQLNVRKSQDDSTKSRVKSFGR